MSRKYQELVCTAGITDEGEWIRIYPVPFRNLPYKNQYKKYDWLEIDVIRNKSDFRSESYRPIDLDKPGRIIGNIDTKSNWRLRKEIVLKEVFTNLDELIARAKSKPEYKSLATFKPKEVIDFKYTLYQERNWDRSKLEVGKQFKLFETTGDGNAEVIRKMPYKFQYTLIDDKGKQSTMMIEDWEVGALYWKSLEKYKGDESKACEEVKYKFGEYLVNETDLYFFLGTTRANHLIAPNPFIIIGVFYPKKEPQLLLNLT